MHREADTTIDVVASDKLGEQEQIGVMDPNHVLHCLVHGRNWLQIRLIKLFVQLPKLIVLVVVLVDVEGLEIVKERA